MPPCTLVLLQNLWILNRSSFYLKLAKFKHLNFHWVSHILTCRLKSYYCVIWCHVAQSKKKMVIIFYYLLYFALWCFLNWLCKNRLWLFILFFACQAWNESIKIHKIFSQSSSFVKAEKICHSTNNCFIRRSAKNWLLLHFLQSKDNSKSHTDWQTWRNSHSN